MRFDYRDIVIEATVQMQRHDFRDSNNIGRTRFDRNVCVTACFWNFKIFNNFYELCLIKSSLNFFAQAYWKRRSKQSSKIDLATFIEHPVTSQIIYFTARQKNNRQSLEISLTEFGQQRWNIYLNAQEVLMVDIAVSKAISLLVPETIYINPNNDGHYF